MTKSILVWLLVLSSVPAFASKRVTVEQLSHEIASSSKKKDAKVADRLNNLQLTERLSTAKLAAFESALPGPDSRRALVALADQSEFLDPPAAEMPSQPAPTVEQQRAIIAKAVDYAVAALHRLPNLFARRDTIRYEDTPPAMRTDGVNAMVPYQPLHPVSRAIATVLYRDGQEVVQQQTGGQAKSTSVTTGLTTFGEFGPIFSVVFGDLPKGDLTWGHWETGLAGPVAVFHFAVPKAVSHYQVEFCCIAGRVFKQFSAYHGELTVEPSTGTILRLMLIADLSKGDPVTKADLMVDYGPVALGGNTYFCPIRSISISVAPMEGAGHAATPFTLNETPVYMHGPAEMMNGGGGRGNGSPQTMLNETVFEQYHLFRGEVDILTANNAEQGSSPAVNRASASGPSSPSTPVQPPAVTNSAPALTAPAPALAAGSQGENGETANTTTAPAAAALTAPPAAAPSEAPSKAADTASATNPPAATPPPASNPEISVAAPQPFPDSAAPASANPAFSIRLNTRLVDIGVTAYDKKGRPVTDLTGKDFVIYDDGRKVTLETFRHVGAASAVPESAAAASQPVLYSNRPGAVGKAQPADAPSPESSTILLLDPTSLSFADLTHAREQILKFLEKLPQTEPVALYVRTGAGFQILAEETADHAALSSTLRKWIPTAPDLARAQEEEKRNRQQFDYVQSPSEMPYVNGNTGGTMTQPNADPLTTVMTNAGGNTTSDPRLVREGANPAREALSALIGVAANLDAIPGHKDLVWVASDNVLANWTDQAPGIDRGANPLGGLVLRAQEALNDAHVSLYPLDASQFEAMATDASLANSSVQLNPAVSDQYPSAGAGASVTNGRATAEMRQDMHAVEPAMQHLAQATGGRSFQRSGNVAGELNSVIADGHAAYLLSFAPDTPPDDKYHRLTVTVPERHGLTLRYRAGYLYTKEPATLKERFRQAVWQPQDETEIGLSARWDHASEGAAISLDIAATDIGLAQQRGRWTGKLDVFLVQRDNTGTHATVKEETLVLDLKPETYQKVLHDGIPFAEYIPQKQSGTVRIIVVDENSGRLGSVTLPTALERAKL